MDLSVVTYGYVFLGILLVPLMGLDGARESCPTSCRCTSEVLNCSRIANLPGFHRVPLPNLASPLHPFMYLDFTGNDISSIGKEVWEAYPWTTYLVLKDNSLSKLQNTSLEGLLSLTYLDLSCNKIQIIENNVFETIPFLQVINLSGNDIQQITDGTFQAWHGMQFLLKVDLSHNPLAVIHDSYFYGLPSLNFLDLGATEVTHRVLEDLLQTTLQLRTLILPQKMSCCLCHVKKDVEALCETIKLKCTASCDISATLCEKEESLNRMQEDLMKVLEIRRLNGGSLLNILPEKAVPDNELLEQIESHKDRVPLAESYSSLAANLNLFESIQQLMQVKADEPLDVTWTDKGELKKLYLLASLLQEALKNRIMELEKGRLELAVQNELSGQASKVTTDKAVKGSTDASLRRERHMRKITRGNRLGTNGRLKDILIRLARDGQEVAETVTQSADKLNDFELHKAGSHKKQEGLNPQRALPFLRSRQAALQASRKRSVSNSLTNALMPTGPIAVENNDNDLTRVSRDKNSMALSGNGFGAHTLTKEELLNQLLHRGNRPTGDGKSKASNIYSEPSLNELSPDITLSHETYWEHQRPPVSPPLKWAPQGDYLLQGNLFEAELNNQLASLIPNTLVRRFISHLIRVLNMDCTAPTTQKACAKLISKTGLLIKIFNKNVDRTLPQWKPYFWPAKNIASRTTASSRKLETPLGRTGGQGIPIHEYASKMLWAVSAGAIIVLIIAVICLTVICCQHSAIKERLFAGKRKKSSPDLEAPRADPVSTEKPLSPRDSYQAEDETQNNIITEQLPDEEPEENVSWGSEGQSFSASPVKKTSSPTNEVPPAPATAPLRSYASTMVFQKPSVIKDSDSAVGTSVATSSKTASSAAEDEEEDEEDEETSAEKSEVTTTVASTEATEIEEEEEED